MRVKEIMTANVVTVEMDHSLKNVQAIFDRYRFHHLLVVEEGKLVGVVSDRDLLRALSPRVGTASESAQDTDTLRKKVHQIMTRNPVTLRPNATVFEAMEIFDKHVFSCIPIVDKKQRVRGILSWRDIIKTLLKAREAVDAAQEAAEQAKLDAAEESAEPTDRVEQLRALSQRKEG